MADFADLEQGDAQPMKIASSGSLNGKSPAGTTTKASYVEQSQKAIRQGFIRKVRGEPRSASPNHCVCTTSLTPRLLTLPSQVYGILTLQLLLTIGTCVLMTRHAATRAFVLATPALSFTAMGLSFVVLVSLFCFKDRHPLNVLLLTAFTLCESYVLGVVCAQYVQAGHARIILQALALTAAVFVALTVFAFQVRRRRRR